MNVLKIKVNGKEGLIPYFEEENGFILDKKLNINSQFKIMIKKIFQVSKIFLKQIQ